MVPIYAFEVFQNRICGVVRPQDAWKGILRHKDGREHPHHDYSGINYVNLMQFTGLLDKNGREIYESDIISYPETESTYVDVGVGGEGVKVAEVSLQAFFPVQFRSAQFGIQPEGRYLETLQPRWYSLAEIYDEFPADEIEVVGNIYENPELLK